MAPMTSLAATDARAQSWSRPGRSGMPDVPTTRSVQNLRATLDSVRRLGGSVTSETRTVPGIGSWAFIVGDDGREVVVWEDAPSLT